METNFIIAQAFGVLSMISNVCSMQFKRRKAILVALFCLSLFAAINLILLDSFASAYITLFAIVEIFVNYLFERKKKVTPNYVVALYIICNIALGVVTFTTLLDIIPIAAAIVFCFTLLAKDEQDIRKLMFLNQCLWLVFDASVGAYALACSNVLALVSTVIAYNRFRKQTGKTAKSGKRQTAAKRNSKKR